MHLPRLSATSVCAALLLGACTGSRPEALPTEPDQAGERSATESRQAPPASSEDPGALVAPPTSIMGQRAAGLPLDPYEADSTLAFAGGQVAYATLGSYNQEHDLYGPATGPLHMGDLTQPSQPEIPGTADAENLRVAAGPDGFVAAWSGDGVHLVRFALSGERVWEVRIDETCGCSDVSELKVGGDFILAFDGIYAWADGAFLRRVDGAIEPDRTEPSSVIWWQQ